MGRPSFRNNSIDDSLGDIQLILYRKKVFVRFLIETKDKSKDKSCVEILANPSLGRERAG